MFPFFCHYITCHARAFEDEEKRGSEEESTALVTEQFLFFASDVIQEGIVDKLAHQLSLNDLRELRLVSQCWSKWVFGVKHLNFSQMYSSLSYYDEQLCQFFQNVSSLKTDISMILDNESTDQFTKIKELEIRPCRDFIHFPKYTATLKCWSSLKKLILPLTRTNFLIIDLCHLTKLTHLEIRGHASSIFSSLTELTNLTYLNIRECDRNVPLSSILTKLTFLYSNSHIHFSSFTGNGNMLTTHISDDPTLKPYYEDCLPGCLILGMRGEWKNGVLMKGYGNIELSRKRWRLLHITGTVVLGKFEGDDIKEKDYELSIMYVGSWKSGMKHGPGVRYRFDYNRLDRQYKCDTNIISKEVWFHGQLQHSEKV